MVHVTHYAHITPPYPIYNYYVGSFEVSLSHFLIGKYKMSFPISTCCLIS